MCGVAGVWHRGGKRATSAEVAAMTGALRHRGPDDEGVYIDGSFGLGHRRLAVIDVSASAHQPMSDPSGRFWLSYNGELYNYKELRQEAVSAELRTNSDTEVFLHLLIEHGKEALRMARGMYALAFWDAQKQELLLARDPFGKKPLFYADINESVWFASEPKALLAGAQIDRELDEQVVPQYLFHEYAPSPKTLYRRVRHLEPASVRTFGKDSSQVERYWNLQFIPKHRDSTSQLVAQFDRLLQTAVERRLIADVPVGLLLSGGIDSSTIGWYIRASGHSVKSFSTSMADDSFDETIYARQISSALGFQHVEAQFTSETFKRRIAELAASVDLPLADVSLLPTYDLSKRAARDVTVVLDGDGADELLGGYGTFSAARLAELPGINQYAKPLVSLLGRALPTSHSYFSLDFKLRSFARGLGEPAHRRNQIWLGSFAQSELKRLLADHFQQALKYLYDATDRHAAETQQLHTTDRISAATIAGYLENDILVKLDRATMYASLEARTPFLDIDVATFLAKLPVQFKRNKKLLRLLMKDRLPREIINRPKRGYSIPIGWWLKTELYEWARETLDSAKLSQQGIFNPQYVSQLLDEHVNNTHDHRKKIWTLLSFQLWYENWIESQGQNTKTRVSPATVFESSSEGSSREPSGASRTAVTVREKA